MTAASLPGLGQNLGRRLTVVGALPALVVVLGVAVQLAAGAPNHPPSRQHLVKTFEGLSATEWTLVAVGVLVAVLVLQPFQVALVRALEGHPLLRGPLKIIGLPMRAVWTFRWNHLNARQQTHDPDGADNGKLLAAAAAMSRLPSRERLLPTRLGNTLRAAEDRPADRYGLDIVVAWPHLHSLLPERAAATTDDARDQLDAACRFTVAFASLGVVSAFLLSGWWLVTVALATAILTVLAYRATIAAAGTYGELVNAVVALHRFDLLKALHLQLPDNTESEHKLFKAVSLHLRQGWPLDVGYHHD
ncbi:hypothetical protein AB0H49_08710 [Nocardia sp. NPDC050713]|uniref:hypothetical protein n=1 Tax=Nocardia sp. NPDC050713 TaxID=3154511 RepID=UPI0033F0A0C9